MFLPFSGRFNYDRPTSSGQGWITKHYGIEKHGVVNVSGSQPAPYLCVLPLEHDVHDEQEIPPLHPPLASDP